MKTRLTTLLLMLCLSGYAQKTTLVADETIIKQLRYSFIVNTCNDTIFKLIQQRFKIKLCDWYVKRRRSSVGPYNDYTIRFSQVKLKEVTNYLKSL